VSGTYRNISNAAARGSQDADSGGDHGDKMGRCGGGERDRPGTRRTGAPGSKISAASKLTLIRSSSRLLASIRTGTSAKRSTAAHTDSILAAWPQVAEQPHGGQGATTQLAVAATKGAPSQVLARLITSHWRRL
jgi:hypothetical protein